MIDFRAAREARGYVERGAPVITSFDKFATL
jgi:hypothetical protein